MLKQKGNVEGPVPACNAAMSNLRIRITLMRS